MAQLVKSLPYKHEEAKFNSPDPDENQALGQQDGFVVLAAK